MICAHPFHACSLIWEPRPREWSLSVCVKAAFTLVPGGEAAPAAWDDPFRGEDWGDERAGLYAPSDFVPFKPRVDVLFVGRAHAPESAPVDRLFVRLSVGDFTKGLKITGRRTWIETPRGLVPGPAEPFAHLPLRAEIAALAGDNGAGIPRERAAPGLPLPCIEAVDEQNPDSTPWLGPVPAAWRARRLGLGADAVRWASQLGAERRGNGELAVSPPGAAPPGLDFQIFNAAPRDQQIALLRAAPVIVLEHLDPRAPRMETRLPALRPKAFRVDPATRRPSEVALRPDTLWIDGDRSIAVVAWRGITVIAEPDERAAGEIYIAGEAAGDRLRFEDVERLAQLGARRLVGTLRLGDSGAAPPPRPSQLEWGVSTQVLPAAGGAPEISFAFDEEPTNDSPASTARIPPIAVAGGPKLGLRLGGSGVATSLLGALGQATLGQAPPPPAPEPIDELTDDAPTMDRLPEGFEPAGPSRKGPW
jgi:hypothetical protein